MNRFFPGAEGVSWVPVGRRVRLSDGRWAMPCTCACGDRHDVRCSADGALRTRKCRRCVARDQQPALQAGRLSREEPTKHGHYLGDQPSPTYKSWESMKQRCTNPSAPNWQYYGGRGITVCARWLASFEAFLEDMGERPAGMTLDRKNSGGNYTPRNTRWATPTTQQRNRANTEVLTYLRVTKALTAWCEDFGLSSALLRQRLRKGMSVHQALTTPVRTYMKIQE